MFSNYLLVIILVIALYLLFEKYRDRHAKYRSKPFTLQEVLTDADVSKYLTNKEWPIICPKCKVPGNEMGNLIRGSDCNGTVVCRRCKNIIHVQRFDNVISASIIGYEAQRRNEYYIQHCIAGANYATAGELDKAFTEFEQVLNMCGFDRGAAASLALVEDALHGKIERETAIHLFRAAGYAEGGDLQKAIEEANLAISLNPNYVIGYETLAGFYEKSGKINEAITEQKKTIQVDPNYAAGYYNLGVKYHAQSLPEKAVEQYHEALKVDPDFPEAHNNLAFYYRDKGENELMLHHRNKAIKAGLIVNLDALHK